MVRWWLVLAVLGVVAGTASAKRDPGACVCGTTITLPRQGATDVPTNARYWTLPPRTDTPDQPIQSDDLEPHTGAGEAEIVVFDLAGNASAPVTVGVTAYVVPPDEATCYVEDPHFRCGTPLVAVVYLAPFIGLIALVVMLLVVAIRSARRRAHVEAEPLAIASAAYLARAVRLRAHVALAFVAAAGAGAYADDTLAVFAIMASPILAALVISALVRWAQSSRFARLLGYDGVTAEVQGDRVTIVVGGKVAFLRASPKLVDRAKRHALPTATL